MSGASDDYADSAILVGSGRQAEGGNGGNSSSHSASLQSRLKYTLIRDQKCDADGPLFDRCVLGGDVGTV